MFRNSIIGLTALAAVAGPTVHLIRHPPRDVPICASNTSNGRSLSVTQTRRDHITETVGGTLHYQFQRGARQKTYNVPDTQQENMEALGREFCRTGVYPDRIGSKTLRALVRELT